MGPESNWRAPPNGLYVTAVASNPEHGMLRHNHPGLVSALAVILGLLVSCASTPQIAANTDPTANLSSYKTYGFVAQPGTNRGGNTTPLTTYFETSISKQRDARGYRKADANPDLLVNFNANVQERTDVQSTPAPVGYYGYRGGLYAGGLYGGADIETVHYKEGTANIDLVDASKRKVVWEGRAEGELSDEAMKNPQAAVEKVITQMFAQFPGRAAGTWARTRPVDSRSRQSSATKVSL